MNFKSLGMSEPLVQILKKSGIKTPTAIQQECIPLIIADKDLKEFRQNLLKRRL